MKKIFPLLITIFYISFSSAQITDSIKVEKTIDAVKVTKDIDTTVVIKIKDTSKIDKVKLANKIDSTQIISDLDSLKIDSIKASQLVYIKKSLLDSLLKPYYKMSIDTVLIPIIATDSVVLDSVIYNVNYIPRFRMAINSFTQDTSFVPLPKTKKYLIVKYKHDINTIVIKDPIKRVKIDKINYVRDTAWWENKNSIGLDINEIAFVNWNAGGENSISGLLKIYFARSYQKKFTLWENEIFVRYGLNKQEDRELRKTDDQIRINSTFGYRKNALSNWYYTLKFNFNTQFTEGYKYPDIENPISAFFAPAYMFIGAGARYNLEPKHFSIYLSPLTLKSTFVFDDELSNEGSFGVEKGKRSRHEFGIFVQSNWDTEIFKNVAMINRLSLYTDYLNNFGNIDVNWDLIFRLKINKFLEANIGAQLIYDDDIKYKEDTNGDGELETFGARVQLKQYLSIGVLYKF